MIPNPPEPPRDQAVETPVPIPSRITAGLILFVLAYTAECFFAASKTPFWMDEILTLWAIRLPSFHALYAALGKGSEFSPPLFPFLMHAWLHLAGHSPALLRAPSLLATLITGAASFTLLRRFVGPQRAALAVPIVLFCLRDWTLQMRPYALVTACFAVTLALWSTLDDRPRRLRCAAIALLLSTAIALHYYGLLFVPCLALAEAIYTSRGSVRAVRWPVWIALGVSAASLALWLPLLHHQRHFNTLDNTAPAFYARPTLNGTLHAYADLLAANTQNVLFLLAILLLLTWTFTRRQAEQRGPDLQIDLRLPALLLAVGSLPILVFLFAHTFTHAMSTRYSIAVAIAIAGWVAVLLPDTPALRRAAPMLLLLAAFSTILPYKADRTEDAPVSSLLAQMPGTAPIVVADGLQFFPLREQAAADQKSRIAYVSLPPGAGTGDPTNQHQIERWKNIDSALNVSPVDSFLAGNPRFYVLDTQSSDDTPAQYLLQRGLIQLVARTGTVMIYKSTQPGHTPDW